jgi:hypothetical protein
MKGNAEILYEFASMLGITEIEAIRHHTVINPYTLDLICAPPVFKEPRVMLNDYDTMTGEFTPTAVNRIFFGEPEPPLLADRDKIWKRFRRQRTTVLDRFNLLPDGYRELAIKQCNYLDNDCGSLKDAIASLLENKEEPWYTFWVDMWYHVEHGLAIPEIPKILVN